MPRKLSMVCGTAITLAYIKSILARLYKTALIVVGDVKTNQFNSKKGKLAKSVYDAGWFEFKRQLEYKCKNAGCRFEIVNGKYTI